MRLHRLTITAFGSFPGTETVDFDALGEAGLFLIHGPTGAGKTTVLDAVCYALYGQVPGQRNDARSLRCDHAPPGRGPKVELEATVRGRRLRLTRSPSWQRPKQRGEGMVEEKAKVLLEELSPQGEWTFLSGRIDEAGDLVGGLLGMNAAQFQQVAMLPQGEFAKFLRADGELRHALLERLFSVKVFGQVEKWLADHRTRTWRDQEELAKGVASVADRMRGAAGDGLLEEVPDDDDDQEAWARSLLDAAGRRAAQEETAAAMSGSALRAARDELDAGRALADRKRRHAEALARQAHLDAAAEERADLDVLLADAARAGRVLPLLQRAEQRAEAETKAALLAAESMSRVLPLCPAGDDDLAALERERRDEIARLGGLRAEEERRAALLGEIGEIDADLIRLAGREAATTELLAALPDRLREAERRHTAARQAEAALPAAEQAHEAATRTRAAVHRRDTLTTALLTATTTLHSSLTTLPRPPLPPEATLSAPYGGLPAGASRTPQDGEAPRALRERLLGWERAVRDELAGLEALRGDEARVRELGEEIGALAAGYEELTQREAAARAALADLPVRLAEATARLDDLRARTAAVPAAEAARDAARHLLEAAELRDSLVPEAEAAEHARLAATDTAQDLREHLLTARQARIDGMAAELARTLVPGEPCAVCGSTDHPRPAEEQAFAPEEEAEAELRHQDAQEARQAAESHAAVLADRLREATDRAADATAAEAAATLADAELRLAELAGAAEHESALAEEAARAQADLEEARERAAESAGAIAEAAAALAGARSELERLTARLESARGEDVSLPERRDRLTAEAALLSDAAEAAGRVAELIVTLAEARAAVPDPELTAEAAEEAVRAAEAEPSRLRALAADAAEAGALAERLAAQRTAAEEEGRRTAGELAAARARRDRSTAEADRLGALIDEARGEDPSLAARLDRLAAEAALLRDAAEAAGLARTAATEAAAARAEAGEAAAEAGFGGLEEVRAAVRPAAELEELTERLRALDAESAAVAALLADPELRAAAEAPDPDLPALTERHDAAERVHAACSSRRDQARDRHDRLTAMAAELTGSLALWRPARERHRLARRLAELTGGTSADNTLDMRLSSYVLGERLRQVVDAANERLDHMSGGRYLLQYDVRKTAGSRKRSGGGLGLRILDGWTGVDRDPATLSGGESFVTSLALALGLADVVSAEAGGAEIGTLFVDEGFGTLDDDTLDGVLDILDGLRDGGRAVGLVSHVAELRTRIPTQLVVTKSRTGSRLTPITT
ncbi:SMC family ATPase [Spongiactinospora rosea]|uniref:Nuclease SbcCD subunit C n=1 Tax=Spongiactinospora rosea TaxID=2248750 RepID=A0A366M0F6_9ACTN|nr:AAA family ATPase [Spongiactinospora rosea]RBQ19517.1 SMC family ATPase [Spongiactinospora rosea]